MLFGCNSGRKRSEQSGQLQKCFASTSVFDGPPLLPTNLTVVGFFWALRPISKSRFVSLKAAHFFPHFLLNTFSLYQKISSSKEFYCYLCVYNFGKDFYHQIYFLLCLNIFICIIQQYVYMFRAFFGRIQCTVSTA